MLLKIFVLNSILFLTLLGRNVILNDSILKSKIEKAGPLVENTTKDIWDKLNAVSGIISGIIVALIGFYAANVFNKGQKRRDELRKDQQLSLSQAETLEKFLPHIMSQDPRLRESSLLIISTLLGNEFVAKLAGKLGGEGSAAALTKFVSRSQKESKESIEVALGEVFHQLENYVVRIVDKLSPLFANGFFWENEGLLVTTAHVAVNLTDGVYFLTTRGDKMYGKIVHINKKLDIAFIYIPEAQTIPGIPKSATLPNVGNKVIALWHSPEIGLRGEVASIISVSIQGISEELSIATTKLGSPGISGAPVVNLSGELIGLVHASTVGDEQLTLLVPSVTVMRAFNEFKSIGLQGI